MLKEKVLLETLLSLQAAFSAIVGHDHLSQVFHCPLHLYYLLGQLEFFFFVMFVSFHPLARLITILYANMQG
jgi:hypothetical protein